MGGCNSVICAKRSAKKNGKIENVAKKEESEEIEEIPSVSTVSIHIGSPSSTGSSESPLELSQDLGTSAQVSSSTEALGNEADDELSSDTSSFLSNEGSDFAHPQEDAFNKRVKSCLPRTVRNHRIGQENDDRSGALASVENPIFSSLKNERQLKHESNGRDEARNWVKEHPGPSGLHSNHSTSLPPPRPSQRNLVCSKKIKEKEELAGEKLKRRPWGFWKKKRVRSQEKEMHANKVRLIKKIKNAIKRKAAQESDSGATAVPPDETIARMFGVTVEDCRDSSSNNSSSTCSPTSTSTSSSTSWDSSMTSDEDLEDPGTDDNFGDVESSPNTPENGTETRPRVTVSRRTFVISKRDLQKPRIGLPCVGEETTPERFRNGHESVETKPPSVNNWDSWDSSTASDDEVEESNVGHSKREVKSTSENSIKEQTVTANSPCSTNSWVRPTTSNSDDRPCSELQSLILESASSWKSSSTSDGDVKRLSTPEIPKNEVWDATTPSSCSSCSSSISSDEDVEEETLQSSRDVQKKARSTRKWFRFRNNKVVPL